MRECVTRMWQRLKNSHLVGRHVWEALWPGRCSLLPQLLWPRLEENNSIPVRRHSEGCDFAMTRHIDHNHSRASISQCWSSVCDADWRDAAVVWTVKVLSLKLLLIFYGYLKITICTKPIVSQGAWKVFIFIATPPLALLATPTTVKLVTVPAADEGRSGSSGGCWPRGAE